MPRPCSGCLATRRGCASCGVLAAERLNVTELTSILGIAQSGVSRHLGLLRDQRTGRGAARRRLHRISACRRPRRATGTQSLWTLLDAQFAAAADDPVARADRARLKEVLRLRKESFAARRRRQPSARAGPELGGVGARARPPAAGVGRRRPRLRRGLSHGRGRALGRPRGCRRPLDRRARTAPARSPAAAASATSSGSAASSRRAPGRCQRRRRAAVAGAAPRGGAGTCARRGRPRDAARRPRARARPAPPRREPGSRNGSAIGGSALTTTRCEALLKGAGLEDVKVTTGARLTGDPFTVLVASGQAREPGPSSLKPVTPAPVPETPT